MILPIWLVISMICALAARSATPTYFVVSTAEDTAQTPASTAAGYGQTQSTALAFTPTAADFIDQLTLTPGLTQSSTPEWVRLPPPPEKRTLYQLEATVDYVNHTLAVNERITYINTTPERLSSIPLVIATRRYPGTFQLASLLDQGGERLQYRWKDTTLELILPGELAPGEKVQFSLSYRLTLLETDKLPKVRPHSLGYNSQQANFGDWYPFIPPYQAGKGWLVHPPSTYGEHLVYDIADFEVGIRTGQTNLVIAAGEPQFDGEWYRYTHLAARNFAWSVSPYYEVLTQTVEIAEGVSPVVASYYFPFYADAGKSLLDTMGRALQVYSKLFGVYSHPMFIGVQADLLDGMEYDGLFFLSTVFYNWHKDTQEDFLVFLAAHETAHQWWYSVVGSDQALEPWLDEALCTYSEHIYYENIFPQAIDWWWTYRVNYYQPEGWVDLSVFDLPAGSGHYKMYRNPVYLRGALFLEELRQLMGDEAFFAALRAYASRFAYQQADGVGFWEVIREHTTQDLSPVLREYFSKPSQN